jgi:outer membrane protein assembly factor BamE (lipoprotein component of BamABCDE complex)
MYFQISIGGMRSGHRTGIMKRRILFLTVSWALAFLPHLVHSATLNYPYVANPQRRSVIEQGYKKIEKGMTSKQVEEQLGEPDEIRPLYEPRVKNGKKIGVTYWYIIERKQRSGSVKERAEKLVRVSFNLKDRVTRVDHWGF